MRRGPCKYCAWLFGGKICKSLRAKKKELTKRGIKLVPLKDEQVKFVSKHFNKHTGRVERTITWESCWDGIGDFIRKRDF